ncbi:MAG TPA: family 10 glycosylhydrolase [Candidatus Limnocylindria bacterium]|nr:family 10 glycosylhydrolase [Candidatus Limnocylindria bacterium]
MDKALWVVRDKIEAKGAIDDLMADATTRGIHDVVVQVRGRGDAYYASSLEPRAETLTENGFDPLAHLVRAGAAVGVRVHAWGNVFFVWSSAQGALPRSREHLVHRHPEWLLRPGGVKYLDPVGGADWEGIYTDPRNAVAREHTLGVFAEIVRRYRVEGFHYDYVRYPQVTYAQSPKDHAAVTALVREGAKRLRGERPGLVISAAVFPDPDVARERVLQLWPDWAREGLVDLLCPMAYRRATAEVTRLLTKARAAAPQTRMWGGLMGYAGERALIRDQVRAARDAGCEGAILFAYDPTQRDLLDAFSAS